MNIEQFEANAKALLEKQEATKKLQQERASLQRRVNSLPPRSFARQRLLARLRDLTTQALREAA